MYKIKESKIDNELTLMLSGKLRLMPNNYLDECKGEDVILALSPIGDIVSVALTSLLEKIEFDYYQALLPMDDFNYIKESVLPNNTTNGIWLDVIESTVKGMSAGTCIIKHLKQSYDSIMLFSDGGADEYWLKNGFNRVGAGIYLWTKLVSSFYR